MSLKSSTNLVDAPDMSGCASAQLALKLVKLAGAISCINKCTNSL